jgi:hypothetical protein
VLHRTLLPLEQKHGLPLTTRAVCSGHDGGRRAAAPVCKIGNGGLKLMYHAVCAGVCLVLATWCSLSCRGVAAVPGCAALRPRQPRLHERVYLDEETLHYILLGLRPGAGYEVRVSYPATVRLPMLDRHHQTCPGCPDRCIASAGLTMPLNSPLCRAPATTAFETCFKWLRFPMAGI